MKFTSYESQGISHWVANSPLMSWAYDIMSIDAFGRLNGSIELIVAALLARQAVVSEGFRGGRRIRLAVLRDHAEFHGHDPRCRRGVCRWLSRIVRRRGVLMKDIANLGLALWLLADSIDATRRQAKVAKAA